MAELPATRPSLLVRLRDVGDKDAWRQFVQIYAPVIYGYARQKGLQDADAADVTQDVLRAVTVATGRQVYDPARGSFRSWLFTIAHHKLCDFRTRQQSQFQGSGDTGAHQRLEEQPAKDEVDAWEQEYRSRLFHWAAERIKGSINETTWQAFWLTAVEGQSGKEVAAKLNLSVAAVYLAKSRVMARLKAQLQEVSDEQ